MKVDLADEVRATSGAGCDESLPTFDLVQRRVTCRVLHERARRRFAPGSSEPVGGIASCSNRCEWLQGRQSLMPVTSRRPAGSTIQDGPRSISTPLDEASPRHMRRVATGPPPVDWCGRVVVVVIGALLVSLAYALFVVVTAGPDDTPPSSGVSIEHDGVGAAARSRSPQAAIAPVANTETVQFWPASVSDDDLDDAVAGVYGDIKPVAGVLIVVQVVSLLMIGYLTMAFRRSRRADPPLALVRQ